jgi:DNA adenine methylase
LRDLVRLRVNMVSRATTWQLDNSQAPGAASLWIQHSEKLPARALSPGPEPIAPFLRWIGGKQQTIKHLLALLPEDISQRLYREPFVGAGSLFFALQPQRAVLSDANDHLIKCYEHVRRDWRLVATYLGRHAARTSKPYYYEVRDAYNRSECSAAQAARFIYLNKTCFNGIFRVNRQDKFNVPYGWKVPPALPSAGDLERASRALCRATIKKAYFETALRDMGPGDFCYLDPPYPPINETAYFTHYTRSGFGTLDQDWLSLKVRQLDARGSLFMMTNADTNRIRTLYRGFHISSLPVTRFVTCKAKKYLAQELVITNY